MDNYIQIGYTKKTQGYKGVLRMVIENAYADDAINAGALFLEIDGRYLPYFVDEIEINKNSTVKFEEVDSKESAVKLTSKGIYLRQSDIKEIKSLEVKPNEDLQYSFLKGYQLHDVSLGLIGEIVDILEFPHQEMASVIHQEKELLVPINEQLIDNIDEFVKKVVFDLPEGILEL